MSIEGTADQIKGRVKQAAGDLTGDDELKAEGQADEAMGEAKNLVDKLADSAHEAIDWLRAKVS